MFGKTASTKTCLIFILGLITMQQSFSCMAWPTSDRGLSESDGDIRLGMYEDDEKPSEEITMIFDSQDEMKAYRDKLRSPPHKVYMACMAFMFVKAI